MSEFIKITQANESIKNSLDLSYAIKLDALNALFAASRGDERGRGFSVAVSELVGFSKFFDQTTADLSSRIESNLIAYSELVRYEHRYRLFVRGCSLAGDNEQITRWHAEADRRFARAQRDHRLTKKHFLLSVRNTLKQCLQSKIISLRAKIESSYSEGGSEYQEFLQRIEDNFEQIMKTLKSIEKQFALQVNG